MATKKRARRTASAHSRSGATPERPSGWPSSAAAEQSTRGELSAAEQRELADLILYMNAATAELTALYAASLDSVTADLVRGAVHLADQHLADLRAEHLGPRTVRYAKLARDMLQWARPGARKQRPPLMIDLRWVELASPCAPAISSACGGFLAPSRNELLKSAVTACALIFQGSESIDREDDLLALGWALQKLYRHYGCMPSQQQKRDEYLRTIAASQPRPGRRPRLHSDRRRLSAAAGARTRVAADRSRDAMIELARQWWRQQDAYHELHELEQEHEDSRPMLCALAALLPEAKRGQTFGQKSAIRVVADFTGLSIGTVTTAVNAAASRRGPTD